MNFLAHAYLSFNQPAILVGNMIGDFVKGKARYNYPEEVQKGIMLHRYIDEFTDRHEATAKAKEPFRADYRLYSGPIVDILFDHFLANDSERFTPDTLKQFAFRTYDCLEEHITHLPQVFARVLTYMKAEDWLYHYRYKERIGRSLHGLARRATYLADSDRAYQLFLEHYDLLDDCYHELIKDVKKFSKERLDLLNRSFTSF